MKARKPSSTVELEALIERIKALKPEDVAAVAAVAKRLETPPEGWTEMKSIGGKWYKYHRWRENGKLKSKYLRPATWAEIQDKISSAEHPPKPIAG